MITAHPEFGPTARRILERIEDGEQALTSSLVIAEVCAWLEYHKLQDKIGTFFSTMESYPSLKNVKQPTTTRLRPKI